jgi:hypothetical protein
MPFINAPRNEVELCSRVIGTDSSSLIKSDFEILPKLE